MAIKSWPYVSIDGDRKITAGDEAQGYDIFVGSGVVPGYLDELAVSKMADTLSVSVAAGAAIVSGHRVIVDAAEAVSLTAGESNPRIDIVCVESNENTPVRAGRLIVVKGTAASSPVAPALTQGDVIWQEPLAQITVPAGAANLNAATLADARVYAPGRHSHELSKIAGLQAALDGKAAASHTQAIGTVTGLQAAIDGKAAASHTHSISNVTGLQAALNGKQSSLNADQRRKITISASNPSGGVDGDVWLKY